VRAGAGTDGAHVVDLDDGSTAEGHEILAAVGRDIPISELGLEHYGLDPSGRTPFPRDGRLRVADGLFVIGDPAGPELHTHQAHYQGERAVRMALGQPVMPDYRALPRATYTDPEAAFVGVTVEAAREAGLDAFELVADFASTARGYGVEATMGHLTIVVDRDSRTLVGAAIACPDASAALHECVVAIQARVPVDVLAETGAVMPFGTDAPVEPYDPWPGLALAVRREDPRWPAGTSPYAPEQSLTLERALRGNCVDAAISARETDRGRLTVGQRADVVVLPAAALDEPVEVGGPLWHARPLQVLVDGEVVFER